MKSEPQHLLRRLTWLNRTLPTFPDNPRVRTLRDQSRSKSGCAYRRLSKLWRRLR